ncbi:MAG TPA: HU family DNA-binding protein [Thermoguttaceae bacterium]|nr:HU family DNA-binding protein [Thermoguttaceae bacterium]HPP54053.1 HU family DNA-binding protein [Thermoguttaceae bacterium]
MCAQSGPKPLSKTELVRRLAETTGVEKKVVGQIINALEAEMQKALGPEGPGVFALPGLVKIERKLVPARPAKTGVPNPFRPGELRDIPARPATHKVRVRALKALKQMVQTPAAPSEG